LFRQPKSAPGATEPAEVGYRYRVVSPLNVLLYKSAPAGQEGDDVICLFTQPLSETSFRAHLLMVLKDQTSPMAGMVAFQQLIFGQDKPILENQRPARLPLTGLTEKSVRADAMSLAYRRWLVELNWRYGAQYERG
jgi:phenylpropionate dioxygenase-like ring-hydroxylating dioxygenase large terminal subunit